MKFPVLIAAASLFLTSPAVAQEVWGGVSAHGVDTPFTKDIDERGTDLQAGYRFAPVDGLSAIGSPEPYVLAVVNLDGETNLVAAGLSWKLGDRLYARPGIGIAIHDGPGFRVDPATNLRTDLGSRVLFEPEIAVGFQATPRLSIEASWIHVSHAQLFGGQNPGLDIIGVRATWRL